MKPEAALQRTARNFTYSDLKQHQTFHEKIVSISRQDLNTLSIWVSALGWIIAARLGSVELGYTLQHKFSVQRAWPTHFRDKIAKKILQCGEFANFWGVESCRKEQTPTQGFVLEVGFRPMEKISNLEQIAKAAAASCQAIATTRDLHALRVLRSAPKSLMLPCEKQCEIVSFLLNRIDTSHAR